MFSSIEKREEFDEVIVQKLKELAARKDLQKAEKVSKVLVLDRGDDSETN